MDLRIKIAALYGLPFLLLLNAVQIKNIQGVERRFLKFDLRFCEKAKLEVNKSFAKISRLKNNLQKKC